MLRLTQEDAGWVFPQSNAREIMIDDMMETAGEDGAAYTANNSPDTVCVVLDGLLWTHCLTSSDGSLHDCQACVNAPSSLQTVDEHVWTRFRSHALFHWTYNTTEGRWSLLAYVMLMGGAKIGFDRHGYEWAGLVCLFTAALLSWWSAALDSRVTNQCYDTLVRKMAPTFEAQGFSMELKTKTVYCCFPIRFVEFTPNGNIPETRITNVDRTNQPYVADDWAPMEGIWTRTQHKNDRKFSFLSCFFSPQAVEMTVSGTETESSFSFQLATRGRIGYGICGSKTLRASRLLQGNTATLQVPSATDRVQTLLSDTYGLTPLGRRGSQMYYRDEPNGIICIDVTLMTQKRYEFEYVEDTPEDSLVLDGILDDVTAADVKASNSRTSKGIEGLSSFTVYERTTEHEIPIMA